MELEELRKKIDEIDSKLVSLYEERVGISEQIALYKIENNLEIFDPKREVEKIKSVRSKTHDEFTAQCIEELFEHILALSRKKQYAIMKEKGITEGVPDEM